MLIPLQVFDEIRQRNPKQLDKVRVLRGDVTIDDLGLSERDLNEVVKNVSVIFHCAANVRFDQTLKGAVNFNTFGTIRLLKVAEQIKNLKVFVHVSTAYCQCNEDVLLEQHYPAPHNPDGIIQMTKLLDDDILTQITPKLLDKLPNTYAYSKALTEDVVNSYADRIPIVIARPSIVSAAWKQPLPGWVEGVNGPTGLMIGAGRGVIRTMHCNASYKADVFPVDMTVNCLIALAWQRDQDASKRTIFCNITDSGDNSYTWGESIERGRQLIKKYPFCFSLWYPDGSIKVNYYYHLFCVIFFHYLPAYCIDALLFIFRKKPL
jgi:alcohol-forming fatty acyl-CoA reductase